MNRIDTQYRIIEAGAGWMEQSDRARLAVEGRDAMPFLQALVTNDLAPVNSGGGIDAAYLTPQGRMIAMLRILRRGDDLLVEAAPGQGEALASRLDQLIFTEQVRVSDITASTTDLSVVGGGAVAALARLLNIDASELSSLSTLDHVLVGETRLVRTDDWPLPGFELMVPSTLREHLVAGLGTAGAVELDAGLVDALRIDAGRPAFGVDIDETTIPLEAGLLERAISTTKGCYVGQEVIIRVLHRGGGRVARRLVQLAFETRVTAPPSAGTPLAAAGQETGRVTSAAFSPRRRSVIALGYVHRDVAIVGTKVTARTVDGDVEAEIVGLAA